MASSFILKSLKIEKITEDVALFSQRNNINSQNIINVKIGAAYAIRSDVCIVIYVRLN